ncbi:MAG: hypothetical protein MUE55_08900, partial [Thermoplasmata archaeon]|nr:hypothetical protein [Thermoplasmata archaeon]
VYDDWSLSAEETQYGMINYVDGVERMLLAIRVDADSLATADQAVWIFTVPGDAGEVGVDLMPGVTELNGEPYSDLAQREFCTNLVLGYGTQLYPALLLPFMDHTYPGPLLRDYFGDGYYVEVTAHVESHGLTVEVVSAQHAADLEAYLLSLGLVLDAASYSLVGGYLGDDFAFVISWISDLDQFREEVSLQYDHETEDYYYELGLFSEFPTDRLFYPLRLTSVYGETTVPMLLQVLGFVEPDGAAADYDALGIAVEHKVHHIYRVPTELSPFFAEDGSEATEPYYLFDVRYTEMVIEAPSDLLEADLWMVPASSAALDVQTWVLGNGFLAGMLVIIGLSSMSGVVAGALVFAPHRPVLWKFALLGIANLLTVVGLWLVSMKLEVERTMTRSDIPVQAKPYRTDFLVVFSFVFVVSMSMVLMAFWV